MSLADDKLIAIITEQVIAALSASGGGAGGTGGTGGTGLPTSGGDFRRGGVEIHPPLGTCTGDRTKFIDPQTTTATASQNIITSPPVEVMALDGIVTANQLQAAIDASSHGIALLTETARLTPLANDLARQYPEKIKRVSRATSVSSVKQAAADQPWCWWMQGHCQTVATVMRERNSRFRTLAASHSDQSQGQVIRDLASAIRSGATPGGLLFVPSAARILCYANRCASIRAVVGTCGEAVEQGIKELGANVLVIEYPHHGPRAITTMVDRFSASVPKAPPAIERDLADLHRCG